MSSPKRKAEDISPSEDAGWSIGPSDNFSDWVIQVVEETEGDDISGKETAYHVHRKDLSCGKYKSDYFVGVFKNKGFTESEHFVTRIEFESQTANAMPVMLNFLYTGELLGFRNEHMVPLFQLADYFMVESMLEPLKGIMKRSSTTVITDVYKYAVSVGHEGMLNAIVECLRDPNNFVRCLDNDGKEVPFLRAIDLAFFLRLLPSPDAYLYSRNEESWKKHARAFISMHKDEIGEDEFTKIVLSAFTDDTYHSLDDINRIVELLEMCPNVEGLPLAVQESLVMSATSAIDISCYEPDERELEMPLFWKILDLTKDVSEELRSPLHDKAKAIYTKNPNLLEDLQHDKLKLLQEALPSDTFLELVATLQKQCVTHKEEAQSNRAQLQKFHRFDEPGAKGKIYRSHDRSGEAKAGVPEMRLPSGESTNRRRWVYDEYDDDCPLPLYLYY